MRTYLNLMNHVLEHGTKKSDRTGTLSVFGYQMRFKSGRRFSTGNHQESIFAFARVMVELMRWLALVCVLMGTAVANDDDDERQYSGESVRDLLRSTLAQPRTIRLENPSRTADDDDDAGEPCETPTGTLERGSVNHRRAKLWSSGPRGSGRYWDLFISIDGKGACFTTTTTGWRNLSPTAAKLFGRWKPLVRDRLHIWSTLGYGDSLGESLIFPLVYRFSDDSLVLDCDATVKEIERFANLYTRATTLRDESHHDLHRAAAAGYHAFATGKTCP